MKFNLAIAGTVVVMMMGALGSSVGQAATQYDIEMPDKVMVQKTPLLLNGMGLRKVSIAFVKIKVYVAGLYLEALSQNAEEILKSKQIKKVDMRFLRNVPKERLVTTWVESLKKNCQADCEKLQPAIAQFASMLMDFEEKDTLAFTFFPTSVEVYIKTTKTQVTQKIENDAFGHLLLLSWLGPNAANEDLKEGLLQGATAPAQK